MGTMRRPPGVLAGAPVSPVTSDVRPSRPSRTPSRTPRANRPQTAARKKPRGRIGIARALAGWAALPVLIAAALLPGVRPGSLALLGAAYVVLVWFVAARTKTTSWSYVVLLLLASVPWAALVGLAAWGLEETLGSSLPVVAHASVMSAVAQQSLLLVPLLLLVLLAPTRARRFSMADWLLTGVVIGAGFELTYALLGPRTAPGFSFSLFAGSLPGLPGQPVLTGLGGGALGFAVAARRHANKASLSLPGRLLWLGLTALLPLLVWWLAVSAQTVAVLGGDTTSVPPELVAGWRAGLEGAALGWLLVALMVLALLVDAGRLRNAAELEPDPVPHPFHPVQAADAWAGRATRWAGTSETRTVTGLVWLVATACSVVAFAGRDLGVVFAAVRRSGRGSGAARWTAISRGRAAGVMVRWVRAEAIGLAADPATRSALRRNRFSAIAGLLVLGATVALLGPYWAGQLDDRLLTGLTGELPGAAWPADALGRPGPEGFTGTFWIVLLVAVVALLAGAADWSALGYRNTFLSRRPVPQGRASIGEYLRGTGFSGAIVDLACLLAGTLPSRAETHPSGSAIRAAIGDFRADPRSFIERRRRQIRAGKVQIDDEDDEPDVLPAVRRRQPGEELPALKLADGRLLSPLSPDAEREFTAHLNGLDRYEPEPEGDGAQWRVRQCGRYEFRVSGRPEIWSSGTTERSLRYGLCVFGLWYSGGSSWQVSAGLPPALPDMVRHRADLELDRRLIEFTTVVNYPGNPFRAVEVVVSDQRVAESVQARMDRLAIPGIVVVAQ
ncbi:hypothetical protein GCM10022223_19790 [Kineosporia mesophila]|uniref:Uncharacterized protein n=1 Tax=Kineosporia mesophila TaxID=566012 RepID=A0ABP6ZEW1_9ACTN|nr:hypothetical protein [Kineosporia mesophila]MCD5353336.1 hypothetical protein [Kineosporia mesophila]